MRFFVVLFSIFALVPDAHGTTLINRDLTDLVERAELVFTGTVEHTEVRLTAESGFPFTLVTFAVDEILLGSSEPELTLLFAGGRTEDEVALIPGMPLFERGGRHLLFVRDNADTACPVVGWTQGKLDIVRHPDSGEEILVTDSGQLVDGVGDRDWNTSVLRIAADGTWLPTPETGITLLAEHDVVITGSQEREVRATSTAALERVLDQVRAFIGRSSSATRPSVAMRSATAADVPPTLFPRSSDTRIPAQEEGR